MGVVIGVLVLLLSVALVVLLALSEWFDLDLGASAQKAVAAAVPAAVPAKAAKAAKASPKKAAAKKAVKRAVKR